MPGSCSSCSGDQRFPLFVTNLAEILVGARKAILEAAALDDAPAAEAEPERRPLDAVGFDAAMSALRNWGERPDAAIWFAMAWAEGVRGE